MTLPEVQIGQKIPHKSTIKLPPTRYTRVFDPTGHECCSTIKDNKYASPHETCVNFFHGLHRKFSRIENLYCAVCGVECGGSVVGLCNHFNRAHGGIVSKRCRICKEQVIINMEKEASFELHVIGVHGGWDEYKKECIRLYGY